MRALVLQPGVDVGLSEAPLATHPDRRNLAGLDQPVDGSQVDPQVREHLVRRQKGFVGHHVLATRIALREHQLAGPGRRSVSGVRWSAWDARDAMAGAQHQPICRARLLAVPDEQPEPDETGKG